VNQCNVASLVPGAETGTTDKSAPSELVWPKAFVTLSVYVPLLASVTSVIIKVSVVAPRMLPESSKLVPFTRH
jgi:hypothetical protein